MPAALHCRYRALLTALLVLAAAPAARGADEVAGISGPDRTRRWGEDLDLVRDEFLARDLSYTPATRAEARRQIELLRARVPTAGDPEIVAGLARIAALAGNAHTRAYLLRNRGYWRRYPIRIWHFADGWRVIAARGPAAALVGGRLVAVGGHPVEQAFRTLRPLFAGNDGWARYMGGYSLTSPDALLGTGLIRGDGATTFTVEIGNRRRTLQVAPAPFERREGPEENWWFLSPAHPASRGWVHALDGRPLPELLRTPAVDYRFARCSGDVTYVAFNRAADTPGGEGVAAWGNRLLADIAGRTPQRLVLDLRFNTGGNMMLARPFIDALARTPLGTEAGRLIVVTGGTTFSAGITPAAALRADSRALLAGEPPGDHQQYWSEGGNVMLPNSRIPMHYANGLHHYSTAPVPPAARPALYLEIPARDLRPDRLVGWSWGAYRAGRDPVTEAVLGRRLECPPG